MQQSEFKMDNGVADSMSSPTEAQRTSTPSVLLQSLTNPKGEQIESFNDEIKHDSTDHKTLYDDPKDYLQRAVDTYKKYTIGGLKVQILLSGFVCSRRLDRWFDSARTVPPGANDWLGIASYQRMMEDGCDNRW